MNSRSIIYSIFGQIETVAAEIMIEKHGARRIDPSLIPREALYNKDGDRANLAVIMDRSEMARFEKLIRDLRA